MENCELNGKTPLKKYRINRAKKIFQEIKNLNDNEIINKMKKLGHYDHYFVKAHALKTGDSTIIDKFWNCMSTRYYEESILNIDMDKNSVNFIFYLNDTWGSSDATFVFEDPKVVSHVATTNMITDYFETKLQYSHDENMVNLMLKFMSKMDIKKQVRLVGNFIGKYIITADTITNIVRHYLENDVYDDNWLQLALQMNRIGLIKLFKSFNKPIVLRFAEFCWRFSENVFEEIYDAIIDVFAALPESEFIEQIKCRKYDSYLFTVVKGLLDRGIYNDLWSIIAAQNEWVPILRLFYEHGVNFRPKALEIMGKFEKTNFDMVLLMDEMESKLKNNKGTSQPCAPDLEEGGETEGNIGEEGVV